jgi:hypothetical protein
MSKSEKPAGICKLCGKTAKLCRSHIIPNLAYRPIRDETNRMAEVSFFGKGRDVQTGYWEHMLCVDCEQRFSRWETYFAGEWTKADRIPPKFTRAATVQISRLEYAQFKLFHLSILWRLGASSRPENNGVKLGPHLDRIGAMLLNDDPGSADQYPFWAHLLFYKDGRISTDIVVPPYATKRNSVNIYVVVFGGCAWYYCVSSHDPGDLAPRRSRLTVDGDLFLTAMDAYSYPPIKRVIEGYLANSPTPAPD